MPPLLTREHLAALTGTKQPKRMCAWLTERGWAFEPPRGRADIPKVDQEYYSAKMSGKVTAGPVRSKPRLNCFGGK